MLEDEPTSPRTRISKWLSKADGSIDKTRTRKVRTKAIHSKSEHRKEVSSHPEQPAQPSGVSNLTKDLSYDNHALTSARHQKRVSDQPHRGHGRFRARLDDRETKEPAESSKPPECGIAKRMGLQGPFRGFGNEEGPVIYEKSRSAKRQRKVLSSSSDLQPAILADRNTDLQEEKVSYNMKVYRNSATVSHGSDQSTMLFSSPKRVEKTYERRPRHKTREDLYEVQPTKERKKKAPTRGAEKEKPVDKRRKRMKSGGVLMHDFNAPNIPNDRLTVITLFSTSIATSC